MNFIYAPKQGLDIVNIMYILDMGLVVLDILIYMNLLQVKSLLRQLREEKKKRLMIKVGVF
jgi:hypothetical protein